MVGPGQDLGHPLRRLTTLPSFTALWVGALALSVGFIAGRPGRGAEVILQPLPEGVPERATLLWSGRPEAPRAWVRHEPRGAVVGPTGSPRRRRLASGAVRRWTR